MRALVTWFLGDLERRVVAIRSALDAHDAMKLRSLAHQLAGAAGGYGFEQIGSVARDLECRIRFLDMQRNGRLDAVDPADPRDVSREGASDGILDDGLAEEMQIASLAERAEDLISLCRRAIDGREGGTS